MERLSKLDTSTKVAIGAAAALAIGGAGYYLYSQRKGKAASASGLARLQCAVQHYEWGRRGANSTVAKLHHSDGTAIAENKPYAELWCGTHKSAPSHVLLPAAASAGDSKTAAATSVALKDWLGGELPYLFKVLSVETALSIQSHPTKAHGAALHAANPKAYPDPNHKPEMTIALTRFEAMCGFRRVSEIAHFLRAVPEFRALIGAALATEFETTFASAAAAATNSAADSKSSNSNPFAPAWPPAPTTVPAEKPLLQRVFGALMNADSKLVATQLSALIARLQKESIPAVPDSPKAADVEITELIQRLNKQYPSDVGVFCPFMLNAVVLQIGDAIFLPANEPHAYISGDCIECMAASDNVVRAGLTPKFRDVSVLVDMLTYQTGRPAVRTGVSLDSYTRTYVPPAVVSEFMATRTKLPPATDYTLPGVSGDSIVLCVTGDATVTVSSDAGAAPLSIRAGSAFVVRSGLATSIRSGASEVQLYRCSPNASAQ